jgi:hypothetical protein
MCFFGLTGFWTEAQNKDTVLCPLIIKTLISYIFMYYIIIKLLIMENHPSQNQKRNSICDVLKKSFSLSLTPAQNKLECLLVAGKRLSG